MGLARADYRPPGPGFVLAARGADRIVLGRRRPAVAGKGRRISRSLFFSQSAPESRPNQPSAASPAQPGMRGAAAPRRRSVLIVLLRLPFSSLSLSSLFFCVSFDVGKARRKGGEPKPPYNHGAQRPLRAPRRASSKTRLPDASKVA